MLAFIPNFGKIRFETQTIYLRKSGSVNKKVTFSDLQLPFLCDVEELAFSITESIQNLAKQSPLFDKKDSMVKKYFTFGMKSGYKQ